MIFYVVSELLYNVMYLFRLLRFSFSDCVQTSVFIYYKWL